MKKFITNELKGDYKKKPIVINNPKLEIMQRTIIVYRGFYRRNDDDGVFAFGFNNLSNHIKNLLNCFKYCEFYIHTYSCGKYLDDQLLSYFSYHGLNVVNVIFEKTVNEKISYSIIKSLQLINENKYKSSDIIINMRFDLEFIEPISKLTIEYNKINFAFKDLSFEKNKKVSDLFYILPYRYLKTLIYGLQNPSSVFKHAPGHYIYIPISGIIGTININFLIDGCFSSNTDIPSGQNGYINIKRK